MGNRPRQRSMVMGNRSFIILSAEDFRHAESRDPESLDVCLHKVQSMRLHGPQQLLEDHRLEECRLHDHGLQESRRPFTYFRGKGLQLGRPEEILRSDGGYVRRWKSSEILRCTQVDMYETTLEENGLLIPRYIDAPGVAYIHEGSGILGVVYPFGGEFRQKSYVRQVNTGDFISIPDGVVFWLYNNRSEPFKFTCVADTSNAPNPGEPSKPYHLAGGKEQLVGGLLHGFSDDMLSEAFGVDVSITHDIFSRQKDVTITRAGKKFNFPYLEGTHRDGENDVAAEFTFSMHSGKADLIVPDGGWLSFVTRNKLPVLSKVGLSAVRVKLEPRAMIAPLWSPNAHQIIRFLRGDGRVEVASNDGESLLQEDLKENDVIIVPKFYPSTIIAGERGLEFIKILTSDSPTASYFAGGNSVYKAIPAQVVAEALQIPLEEEIYIRQQRRKDEVILPAVRQHEI
ncbi:hypothetical protein KP509_23G021000 [Ceratopteris richardii]|uniref:Cupin type-1 domain-containing protein n=1 Tax=Ceratopteris richardii TaxID=49495 RepID=A0A8T2RXP0_CERRI|nr:hypothetical protein KP509_23G021000 [Ceratopteris richardii]